MNKIKKMFQDKRFRYGTYSTFMAVLVIAFLIVINLIAGSIDKSIDLTDQQLYSLSDDSKMILSMIDEDVVIYKLFKTGSDEGDITAVNEILKNYTSVCPYIKVEERDPYIHPKFVEKYSIDESIPVNSLIVEKGNRFRVIKPSQFYSKSVLSGEDVLDIESQITNAVVFVSLEKTPAIYYVTGHNEQAVPGNIKMQLEYAGYEIKEVNMLEYDKVPDECDLIMMTSPENDYSVQEVNIINDFLAKDGRALVCLNFTVKDLPNFQSIINAYGVETTNGVIHEDNPGNYYAGDTDILIPDVADHEAVSYFYSRGFAPRIKFPQPLKERDVKKNTLTLTSILTTSANSYCKYDDNTQSAKFEEKDEKGPFTVGYAVVDKDYTDKEHITKMIVIGSSAFLDDDIDIQTGGYNNLFVTKCFNWLNDNSIDIYIAPKSIEVKEAEVNGSDEFNITLFTCGIVPLGILITGFVVWLKRRNK